MPTPLDKRFRDDKRTLIWRAIRTIFREAPLIKPGLKTLRAWEGNGEVDARDPAPDECPWIRITPGNMDITKGTNADMQIPMSVNVEFAVAGTNIDNLMNVWGAIEDTFGYHSESPKPGVSIFRYLADVPFDRQPDQAGVGVYEAIPTFAGLSPKFSQGVLIGTGRILLRLSKPY